MNQEQLAAELQISGDTVGTTKRDPTSKGVGRGAWCVAMTAILHRAKIPSTKMPGVQALGCAVDWPVQPIRIGLGCCVFRTKWPSITL